VSILYGQMASWLVLAGAGADVFVAADGGALRTSVCERADIVLAEISMFACDGASPYESPSFFSLSLCIYLRPTFPSRIVLIYISLG
jgi:hypothetical protein